ncbi:MAG: hypothetical protein LUE86_13490, partial [Clostridiales bacterium]|nr:hypothetical protein [Clostridiales bacterium]
EDPAEYHYYYMQSSGKAYTAGDSDSTKFKTIDGKRYAFDDDGIMLYGWVDDNAEMQNDDDGWASSTYEDAMYYCGSWEDGAMKTGWQYITVYDDEEDDDMNYWFYFQSNGKRLQKKDNDESYYRTKTINGKKYGFDERGVMVYEWVIQTSTGSTSQNASASAWQYFSSPEDGARKTKGWFKVIPPNEDNVFSSDFTDGDGFDETDADDEDENWYYADGDGELYAGEIKKIKGKYYGFQPDDGREGAASMLSGLVLIKVESDGTITDVIDDGVDSDELDDLLDGDDCDDYSGTYDDAIRDGYTLYYFGDADNEDTDGAMKTGTTTINLDGDSYTFYFSKSGGKESKGHGVTGIDDDKYIYKAGCRIKADSDDKYQVVAVEAIGEDNTDGSVDISTDPGQVMVTTYDGTDVRNSDCGYTFTEGSYRNDDDDTLRYVVVYDDTNMTDRDLYLVNTSGTLQKNKTAAKDGDDWYFYVKNYKIRLYTNEKELTPDVSGTKTDTGLTLDDWKDWD